MSSDLIFGGRVMPKCKPSKYHTIEAQNWHIRRYGHCLYCNIGSKPVHSSLIDSDGEWKVKDIKELKK